MKTDTEKNVEIVNIDTPANKLLSCVSKQNAKENILANRFIHLF